MDKLKVTFSLFDKDGNGSITKEEFSEVLQDLGDRADGGELKHWLSTLADDSGNVSLQSFSKFMDESNVLSDIKEVFKNLTAGKEEPVLTFDEFAAAMREGEEALDEAEIATMFSLAGVPFGIPFLDEALFIHLLSAGKEG